MNLIADIGNTAVKLAVFKNDKILELRSVESSELDQNAEEIIKNYPELSRAMVSSVGNISSDALKTIDNYLTVHYLNHQSKLPFVNNYTTPQTLGVDRMALVSAAVYHYPNQNVLIIDAGTCITYDFVDSNAVYHGGAISPGIRLRYKSLNNYTANLPLLKKKIPSHLIGINTIESIHSGVIFGLCREIDGFIEDYKVKVSDLTVILTGGDSKFLSNQLKNSIFANSNFLLEGLNHILEINSI